MSEYTEMLDADRTTIVLDRLTGKGKAIMDLCLERGKNLCMKGFIDCQIEKGGVYLSVVDAALEQIERELAATTDRRRRALLLDLQAYAFEQLRLADSESAPISMH